MLALPHHTFPYTLKKIASTAAAVRWEGIDPTKWPSGKYLFGIIVSDEFGNRGFGVVGAVPGLPTNTPPTIVGNRNPFIVDILSGM